MTQFSHPVAGRLAIVAACLMLLLAPLQAEAQTTPPGMQQVELSDETVTNFIASYPEFRVLAEKYDAQFESDDVAENPMGSLGAMMTSQKAMAEFNALLAAHGFTDFTDWARTAFSIMLAHGWAKEDRKDPASAVDEAIANIRSNDSMPQQQKEAMITQLESQRAVMESFRPLPGNMEVVSRHRDAIDRAVDEN